MTWTSGGDASEPGEDATVLHVDMDAFFLSVELRSDPSLRGIPAAVAGDSLRSVILSASYEARRFGVRSAMPVGQARRLCPQLRLVPPRPELYRRASAEFMAVVDGISPQVEQLSVDEAFLDVAGARRRLGPPRAVAELLRARVREELGLPCSVGAAPVKFVAKMASAAAKPNGVLVVPGRDVLAFLHPLPVDRLWGVGPVFAERLRSQGIETVGDLAAIDPERLRRRHGEAGAKAAQLSRGIDPRPVAPRAASKSIGVDHTFDEDPTDPALIDAEVLRLCHRVARRLREAGVSAAAVTVRVKAPDGTSRTRTSALPAPTATAHDLVEPARQAVRALLLARAHPLRLLGVRAERLTQREDTGQDALFSTEAEEASADWASAEDALDAVRRRFPEAVLSPAALLRRGPHAPPGDRGRPSPDGPL